LAQKDEVLSWLRMPMRRISNYILVVLQWVLVVWGLFTILTTLHLYAIEASYFAGLPSATVAEDSFSPPTLHRLVVGLCTGIATVGIGGTLFYLRRLYLAR
jgi:hypothetical protein